MILSQRYKVLYFHTLMLTFSKNWVESCYAVITQDKELGSVINGLLLSILNTTYTYLKKRTFAGRLFVQGTVLCSFIFGQDNKK